MATSNKSLSGIMKQAQRMQQQISRITEEMNGREVEASAGGGAVVAVVNGKQQLVSLHIDPEVVNAGDTEMLTELVMTAVNLAMENAHEMVQTEVNRVTNGLNIPGLI